MLSILFYLVNILKKNIYFDMTNAVSSYGNAMVMNSIGHLGTPIVEVTVSCRDLADMDLFSKSDPICVLYTKPYGHKEWKEFGRTEIIWDNLNPNFVVKFMLEYYFEEQQKMKFMVYDVDSESHDLSKHDFLGSTEITLAEIVNSVSKIQKDLMGCNKKNKSVIILTGEELSYCKEMVTLQFKGEHLDKKDFFGKSDPFLIIKRSNESSEETVVHRTEVKKITLNPTWDPFTVSVTALCNGDYDRVLKIECFDWNKDGRHSLIGEFMTSMRELIEGPSIKNVYNCINHEKKKKKGKKYKHSGIVKLLQCTIESPDTFLDYIKGGIEIHCTIAVDFTASNGDPRLPNSLHHIDQAMPNQYEQALASVGEVVQQYDSDKLFPVLGFGAKIPPENNVSHAFFMNGHDSNPYVTGIGGVMEAYHSSLRRVTLHGPTNFAPVINHVANIAKTMGNGNNYFILLILTDGIITDMPQTTEAIVNASCLPLSIIIVGVGDADFEAMDILDGDEIRLTSRGRPAERDIVQFVPFRDFMKGGNFCENQAALAKEVLAEIPEQLLSFMTSHNIRPASAK